MQVLDFVLDAVTAVQSWGLPDESYPEAIIAQAGYLAGLDADDINNRTSSLY